MMKHNQIHTLGTPHEKAHFQHLRKLKDFKLVVSILLAIFWRQQIGWSYYAASLTQFE